MRKPRAQGPLNTLSPEKREVLHRILREPLTIAQLVERVKVEMGITTSASAVSTYYRRVSQEWLRPSEPPEPPVPASVKAEYLELEFIQSDATTTIHARDVQLSVDKSQPGYTRVRIYPLPLDPVAPKSKEPLD